nr:integrase, catalytic region, zinc finger, CCHC-type, peptidase aspartic, catalytic [Tanacetum cinerariifolium]
MSTEQDIYDTVSENHPPMLNKDNYVPWSSLLCYTKSKRNGKHLVNSITKGLYVRKMIYVPRDPNGTPLLGESSHEQTDDEITEKEAKQMEADDQAIQTILMGLPEDIYAVVDRTKKAKFFNEWEKFNSNEQESIESYYHHFAKLINGFSRNKHFQEKIATRAEGNRNGNNRNKIRCYNYRRLGDVDKIEEVNAHCILMGNILIAQLYFVEGLGHNLLSVGKFCDSHLEVAFRRKTCFVRNLEGVDLLKGNRTIRHHGHAVIFYHVTVPFDHALASPHQDIFMADATVETTALEPQVYTWKDLEGGLKYEFGESSSAAQTHPATGEPIHHTIPLILARLARHDDMIDQLCDQFHNMSLDRMGMIECDMETLQARVGVAELRQGILQLALADAREEIMELRTRVSTLEQRAQGPH